MSYGHASWQASFFEGERCKLCGKNFSVDVSNMKRHLKSQHKDNEEVQKHTNQLARKSELPKIPRQMKMTEFKTAQVEVSEMVAMMFATSFIPFALAENPHLQRLINLASTASGSRYTAPSRKTIASEVSAKAKERMQQALGRLSNANVTLAFDSGTVWRRYLVCAAVCPGSPALILHAKCDFDFVDKKLTSENVASFMVECLEMLPRSARVVGLVCDNASNMQKAMSLVPKTIQSDKLPQAKPEANGPLSVGDEEFGDGLVDITEEEGSQNLEVEAPETTVTNYVPIRCMAHSIQLVVKDTIEGLFPLAEGMVNRGKEMVGVKTKIVPTRWGCLLAVAREVIAKKSMINDFELISYLERFIAFMIPFETATNLVQGDSADTWDALIALETMIGFSTKLGDNITGAVVRDILTKRCPFLVSPAMMAIATMIPVRVSCHPKNVDAARKRSAKVFDTLRKAGDRSLPEDTIGEFHDQFRNDLLRPDSLPFESCVSWLEAQRGVAAPQMWEMLLSAAPTEASVERIFSALKKNVPTSRKSLSVTAAMSQLYLKSADAFLKTENVQFKKARAPIKTSTIEWIIRYSAITGLSTAVFAPRDGCSGCNGNEQMTQCDFCPRWFCDECQERSDNNLTSCTVCLVENFSTFRTFDSLREPTPAPSPRRATPRNTQERAKRTRHESPPRTVPHEQTPVQTRRSLKYGMLP